jgi:hypothetical protein
VKLSGRAMPPDERRRRILSCSAGGAQPPTLHGPLQRLLEDPEQFPEIEHELTIAFAQVQAKLCYQGVRDRELRYSETRERELANAHNANAELANADDAAGELSDGDYAPCHNRRSVRPIFE